MKYYLLKTIYYIRLVFFTLLVLYPLIVIIGIELSDYYSKYDYSKYDYFIDLSILVWIIFLLPFLWCLCKLESPVLTNQQNNDILLNTSDNNFDI